MNGLAVDVNLVQATLSISEIRAPVLRHQFLSSKLIT